jgi:hypothetical protein
MGIRIPFLSSPVVEDSLHPTHTGWLHRCAHCRRRILFRGYPDGTARYCSIACFTAGPFEGFCHVCTTTTTDEGPGDTTLSNGIGTSLRPRTRRCAKCHSVLTRKWFVIFLIPIFPLEEYRVRWKNSRSYVARRLSLG